MWREEQYCFGGNKSTIILIFTGRWKLENDGNLAKTCLAFIDIEKEYNINSQEIWKVLCWANVFKGLWRE
jgi:hypothetical protein